MNGDLFALMGILCMGSLVWVIVTEIGAEEEDGSLEHWISQQPLQRLFTLSAMFTFSLALTILGVALSAADLIGT